MKYLLVLLSLFAWVSSEARVQLVEFKNESSLRFSETFCNGELVEGAWIDGSDFCISEEEGDLRISFEDGGSSGYHRPHWKLHVWLESERGFPLFHTNRILYAIVFYDGDAELSLYVDADQKLRLIGGSNVKDILYPWAQGMVGRGTPYHEIQGVERDDNGIKYFDYSGFIGR